MHTEIIKTNNVAGENSYRNLVSYAGFYFCRKILPLQSPLSRNHSAITSSDLAHIYTAYLIAYMLGQFTMSILRPKVATRILLLAGMGISILCNIVLDFLILLGPAGYWSFIFL